MTQTTEIILTTRSQSGPQITEELLMTQTSNIETNKAVVLSVSRCGCVVAVNGKNTDLTWDALDEAATQDVYRGQGIDKTTRELARFYRSIRDRAREMVAKDRSLPITYSVHQDETHVWWVASFRDVSGFGGWIPRAADEGGTHANASLAQWEADHRAASLRKRGYIVHGA